MRIVGMTLRIINPCLLGRGPGGGGVAMAGILGKGSHGASVEGAICGEPCGQEVGIKKHCYEAFLVARPVLFGESKDHEVRGTSARELIRS